MFTKRSKKIPIYVTPEDLLFAVLEKISGEPSPEFQKLASAPTSPEILRQIVRGEYKPKIPENPDTSALIDQWIAEEQVQRN